MASLTGCGENQIPDLSEDQAREVQNYVAMTVMKYQMGRQSRLVDLSLYSDMTAESVPVTDEPQGMSPVDDTPVIDATGGSQPGASGGETVSYRLEEILELPEGVTVAFQGYQVCDSYPEDENEIFYMGASQGKKLLVMNFDLSNTGSQDQAVDMMFPEAVFHVTVNGEYSRRTLMTGLLNDMATYDEVLAGGSTVDVVLVIEVDADMEENINSVDLGVQKETEVYHFQLK